MSAYGGIFQNNPNVKVHTEKTAKSWVNKKSITTIIYY